MVGEREEAMPVTYEIDSSRHLVRTLASGLVTYRELERHIAERDVAYGMARMYQVRCDVSSIAAHWSRATAFS